jgi:hypothetical protein
MRISNAVFFGGFGMATAIGAALFFGSYSLGDLGDEHVGTYQQQQVCSTAQCLGDLSRSLAHLGLL